MYDRYEADRFGIPLLFSAIRRLPQLERLGSANRLLQSSPSYDIDRVFGDSSNGNDNNKEKDEEEEENDKNDRV
jgi:hypothetical protein